MVVCDKRYDETAWTVIDDASFLQLQPGSVSGYPYLDAFPYLLDSYTQRAQSVTCWLPDHPTDAELTTAAVIAARAGQVNHVPLHWRVLLGETPTPFDAADSVILIGLTSERARWAAALSALRIQPIDAAHFTVAPDLPILADSLGGTTLAQAVAVPGKRTDVLYALLAPDDAGLERFCQVLLDPSRGDDVAQSVCVLAGDNTMHVYPAQSAAELARSLVTERQRYTRPMLVLFGCIILAIIWGLFAFIRQFYRRRPSRAKERAVTENVSAPSPTP